MNCFNWKVSYFGCRNKASCLFVGPGPVGGLPRVSVFLRGPKPVFTRVSEKTTENFEWLSRQARSGIESGTSRQPVLSAEPLGHWWGASNFENWARVNYNCLHIGLCVRRECLLWSVFLREPSAYLREFRRKPQKIPNS